MDDNKPPESNEPPDSHVDIKGIAQEAAHNARNPKIRLVAIVCVIVAVLGAILGVYFFRDDKIVAEAQRDSANAKSDKIAEEAEPALDGVIKLCLNPDPKEPIPDRICEAALDAQDAIDDATPIALPPSQEEIPLEEIQEVVVDVCTNTDLCEGDSGPRGPPGDDFTQAELAVFIATYCSASGECEGPQGEPGEQGEQGIRGPPPSDEQVLVGIQTFCAAQNGCIGPVGPQGIQGLSAYEVAQLNGFQGTREEWLASLRGEKGDKGDKGDTGDQGPKGDTGDRGPPGLVNIDTVNCEATQGQYIESVETDYNAETQTVTVTCTKADDQTVLEP